MHTEAGSELEAAGAVEAADAGLALELPVGTWLLGRYRVLGPASDEPSRAPRAHRVRDELLGGERRLRLLAGERVTPRGAEHPALQGRLRHRHLEAVHACERVEVGPPAAVGAWALVTAPRGGRTLAALARVGRLDGELLARVGLAALSALDALARLGLAHGALSPERVELAEDGAVRLLEPGLGALDPGALAPALRAPELAATEPADPRADLYALGATLYLGASGRPPDRPSPLPLSDLRPDLPAALARGVGLLLQGDPRARADLAATRAAFAAALGEAPAAPEVLPAAVEPAFLGRAEPLAAAVAALEDAQALAALGRAARGASASAAAPLLEVIAAEGLGKSRLLEEAALRLARRGARALRAQAFAGGDPYACWRPLIALASEGRDDPLAARAREAVAAASPLGPEARHEHVARFLVALAAERPLAVLIDDAHLLAPAAADLVAHLARAAVSPETGGALALILARRPGAGDADDTPLGRALAAPLTPRGRRVSLGELTADEARALVASSLLGAPAGEVERLTRLGGGSPFLLVELAREWRLGGGTPATVFDSVTARLARLSPPARALAEALAAIGRPLRAATAHALAGEAEAPALAALLEAGVLERAGDRLRFRHGVTRKVLLDALDEEQRAARCRRALAALEQEPDDPEASEGERARLALAARAPQAAERALRAAADDPAPEELYRGALALLPPGPERARAGEAYAARLLTRGAFDEARRALDGAAADLEGQDDPLLTARLQVARSRVARAEGDTHQALRWATSARALLAPGGVEPGALPAEAAPLLAELEAAQAEVATARGDHAGAARLYARAERWAEAARDPRLSATLLLREAGALVLSLDRAGYGEARARVAEARALLEPLDPAQAELDAERTLGNLAWYEGDPAAAEAHFRRALELAEQQANLTLSAGLLNNLGLVGQAQGKLSQAEAALERALDIAERVGQPSVLCRAYTNVGRVRRALGDPRGAARSFRRAARVARAAGDPLIESAALSELGRTRLGERRTAAALEALQRSERLRLALGDVGRVAESQLELGELWRAAGDVGAALAHTGRALALRAALGSPDEAAEAVEALEFAVGRPGGPAALLEAARRPLRFAAAPPPVQAALERGAPLARLALRTLAAALCARAGDLEQAEAHEEQAREAARALEGAAAGVRALGEALTLEAEAVVLAAQGRTDAALARLDQALAGQGAAGEGRATLRAGALRLKRAFLCLVRRDVAGAGRPWSDPEGPPVAPTLPGPLAERRAIGLALLGAAVRRAGRELDAPGLLSLTAAEQAARRLGDVALLALVAAARAEEAAASGSPHEAALERAAAEAAARRLADGLPDALRRGLERAAAPAVALAAPGDARRAGPAPERLLATMTRVLASGLELDPLLGAALDALLEATGAARGLVALVEGGAEPAVRVARGLEPTALSEQAAARAIVAHVAREGLPVDLEDAAARGGRFARGRGTPRAVLALPLRSGGGAPFGVVYLDHPRARAAFDAAARQLARALVATLCAPLEAALRRHERLQELTRRAEALRETARELSGTSAAPALVGRSPAMRALQRLIERYGRTSAAVTIMGESGTGKELVAKALHLASPRKDGPFIVLNCAAIPDSLLESELFGVVKGAFTGADRTRQGLFELAHEGTLFLDEVGDMGLDMQAKLLRVLETGELRPVGGRALVRVDVRIISATHHDLRRLSREGRFREDLLYRLNVLRIELPPLRERSEDLLLLAEHFLTLQAGGGAPKRLSPAALEKLMRHPFPGNVRELRNVIERACILEPGPTIEAERLMLDPAGEPGHALGAAPDYHKTFEQAGVPLNRRQRRLLDHLGGGVSAITNRDYCALVGVSERTGLRDLTELVEHGLLRRAGRRKGARYHLPER